MSLNNCFLELSDRISYRLKNDFVSVMANEASMSESLNLSLLYLHVSEHVKSSSSINVAFNSVLVVLVVFSIPIHVS